jgi:hypothetical protein
MVSDSGAAPTVWLASTTQTNAIFTGALGHEYAFSSIAKDNAGNVEAKHATPDTVIDVGNVLLLPPTVSAVPDQTLEATGPNGAQANFTATATDVFGAADPVVFAEGATSVTSGHVFSLGAHTITASATDAGGRTTSEPFTITVQDTTAPTLTAVADKTVKATGPDGAAVTFTASATDVVDGTDSVIFREGTTVVTSGQIFGIGTHTITASATDVHDNFASEIFTVTVQDADGPVACYGRGTLIRTVRGERPVESLSIGDLVATVSGMARPIKWIGKRSYGGRFLIGQKHILPVCIKAGAIDENTPRRDLWVSPHHAMYLEGVLIEARDLVNDISIAQPDDTAAVEYFHVELDTHDVIIAEGALSETFVDDDSRGMFHNAQEYHLLYPNEPLPSAAYYAPRCSDGYAVEAARRKIARRAGMRLDTKNDDAGKLRGHVVLVSRTRIEGWAQNEQHPEAPVCLDILVDGKCIGQVLANRYRADLAQAGLGSGNHSFAYIVELGETIDPCAVEVRRSLDGAPPATTARCQSTFDTKRGVDRVAIMGRAWAIFRETSDSKAHKSAKRRFAACLRQAWVEVRMTAGTTEEDDVKDLRRIAA